MTERLAARCQVATQLLRPRSPTSGRSPWPSGGRAEELAGRIDAEAQAAWLRADATAAMPMLRAAIEICAAASRIWPAAS